LDTQCHHPATVEILIIIIIIIIIDSCRAACAAWVQRRDEAEHQPQ
jgi:hypothetical protein